MQYFYLREFLLSKIKNSERYGRKFSQTSEMNITFIISDLRNMTYENYAKRPKSMLEFRIDIILAKNPELIKVLGNSSHLLIRKYQFNNEDDEEI